MEECPSGKIGYPTQLDANTALLSLWKAQQRGDKRRRERSTYRCRRCDRFHLTSLTVEEAAARGLL